MNGVVQGGMEYVIAAYAVTGAVFGLMVFSVLQRFRAEEKSAQSAKEQR